MVNEIWVEKYRPTSLNDVILDKDILDKFNEYIEKKEIPHLLLCGDAGKGKTTCAKILSKSLTDEILYINASDETSVDTIRNKVKDFCSTVAFSGLKIIILDESDHMSINAQAMLRNVMEEFADTCRFILTCNYEKKLIEPIKSRCQIYNFINTDDRTLLINIIKRCAFILKQENIQSPNLKEDLTKLVKYFYPDIRKIINNLEKMCIDGQFIFKQPSNSNSDTSELFLSYIKKGDIKTIRQTMLSNSNDYVELYRIIFDNSAVLNEKNKIDIMLTVSEYMYRHSIVIDPEINMVACLISVCKMI